MGWAIHRLEVAYAGIARGRPWQQGGGAARITYCPGFGRKDIARAMLDVMRRQSALIYFVFGAIIVMLALSFGPGANGCSTRLVQRGWAAKVNGEAIPQEEFFAQLGQQLNMRRRRAEASGQPFDQAMLERMGIRRYVVDQLVQQRLLAQAALGEGVQVGDDELLGVLRGQYGVRDVSYQAYQDYVATTYQTTVARFEDGLRREIAGSRIARVLADSVEPFEPALRRSYVREHDRARIEYVRFPLDISSVPMPGEKAVAALLEAEPKAIQDYYERDLAPYETPERVALRQILAEVPGDAPAEMVEAAKQRMMAVRERLVQGEDFVAVAAEVSEDKATREHGGDLGYLARNEIAPVIADALFGQPDGALAGPIRTPRGWHLIQKTAARPAGVKNLEDVREQVAANVLRERVAADRAEKVAERLRGALAAGVAWDRVTRPEAEADLAMGADKARAKKKEALPVRISSGWFRRVDEELPRIGQAPEMQRAAFALAKAGEVAPRLFRVQDSLYVMSLKDRERPDLAKFAEERELLAEEARDIKRRRTLSAYLTFLRSQAKVDINPASIVPSLPATAGDEPT